MGEETFHPRLIERRVFIISRCPRYPVERPFQPEINTDRPILHPDSPFWLEDTRKDGRRASKRDRRGRSGDACIAPNVRREPKILNDAISPRLVDVCSDFYNYNHVRTYPSLGKDAPIFQRSQTLGSIVAMPILGGLHHQYVRA